MWQAVLSMLPKLKADLEQLQLPSLTSLCSKLCDQSTLYVAIKIAEKMEAVGTLGTLAAREVGVLVLVNGKE